MFEKIVESKAFCRKCSSTDLYLREIWTEHSITWEQTDGKFDRNDGSLEMGDPYSVQGECKRCGHRWQFRKTPQIDWLIK